VQVHFVRKIKGLVGVGEKKNNDCKGTAWDENAATKLPGGKKEMLVEKKPPQKTPPPKKEEKRQQQNGRREKKKKGSSTRGRGRFTAAGVSDREKTGAEGPDHNKGKHFQHNKCNKNPPTGGK